MDNLLSTTPRGASFKMLDVSVVTNDDDSGPGCYDGTVDRMRRLSTTSNISRHSSCPDLTKANGRVESWNDSDEINDDFNVSDDFFIDQEAHSSKLIIPTKHTMSQSQNPRLRLLSEQPYQHTSDIVSEGSSSANSTPTSAHQVATKIYSVNKPTVHQVPYMTLSPTSSSCDLKIALSINEVSCRGSSRCSIIGSANDFPTVEDSSAGGAKTLKAKNFQLDYKGVSNNMSKYSAYKSHKQTIRSNIDETMSVDPNSKCQNWLHSLNITPHERIKSRSYISLPPL